VVQKLVQTQVQIAFPAQVFLDNNSGHNAGTGYGIVMSV
jgi:hypothetical protein